MIYIINTYGCRTVNHFVIRGSACFDVCGCLPDILLAGNVMQRWPISLSALRAATERLHTKLLERHLLDKILKD